MNVFDLYHNLVDIRWGKNKEYHYDFMCRDSSGRSFIVEMQCYPEQYWFHR